MLYDSIRAILKKGNKKNMLPKTFQKAIWEQHSSILNLIFILLLIFQLKFILPLVLLKLQCAHSDTYHWSGSIFRSHGVLQKNRQFHLIEYECGTSLWNCYQRNIQFKTCALSGVSERVHTVERRLVQRSLQGQVDFGSGGTQRHREGVEKT